MKFKIEGYDRNVNVLMKDGLVKHTKNHDRSLDCWHSNAIQFTIINVPCFI